MPAQTIETIKVVIRFKGHEDLMERDHGIWKCTKTEIIAPSLENMRSEEDVNGGKFTFD